jgi:glycosyltransferase involved in cell wall biosynthesis
MKCERQHKGGEEGNCVCTNCSDAAITTVDKCLDYNDPLRISVIIPVHNGGEMFRCCLEAIKSADLAAHELIVVVDGGTDGSADLAKQYTARVISRPTAGGPAAARNLGANSASGDIFLFIDADVVIHPSVIRKVMQAFHAHPNVSAIIGSYDDSPSASNFLSKYKNLFHHYTHQEAHEKASTFWGACGAIRREPFFEVGGFDEKYGKPSIEDIDLGYRLRKNGHRILLFKNLRVKHLKRWNILSLLKADFFYRALPWTVLIMKEGKMIDDLNLKVSSRISLVCIYLLALTLPGSFYYPWFLVLAYPMLVSVLILNRNLYRFFRDKRGVEFMLKSIFWHWLYFLYCGLAFFIGFSKHQIRKLAYVLNIKKGNDDRLPLDSSLR